MVRPMRVTSANPPESRCKNNDGQKEENTRDFEPKDSTNPAKRGQKPASSLCRPATHAAHNSSGISLRFNHLRRKRCACGGRSGRRGLGSCGYLLANEASGDPDPDSQRSTNGLRFHSDYDGISVPCFVGSSHLFGLPSCPRAVREVRYINPMQLPAIFCRAGCRSWR